MSPKELDSGRESTCCNQLGLRKCEEIKDKYSERQNLLFLLVSFAAETRGHICLVGVYQKEACIGCSDI